jgi:HEAT repeat protein
MRPRIRLLAVLLALSHAPPARADSQIETAINALQHDRSLKVRTQAALILGQRGAREAVPALCEALVNDGDSAVRIAAATALGRIADPSAQPTLVNAEQGDSDPQVRKAAARALAQLGREATQGRAVSLEQAEGKGVDSKALAALNESLGRHLVSRGFAVLSAGSDAPYRLKPSILELEVNNGDGRVIIAVKASVIAISRDGRMELLQSGARLKASSGSSEKLTARALDAIAKDLAEDLANKLR